MWVLAVPAQLVDAVEEIRREKLRGASWALYRAVQGLVEAVEAGLDCSMAGEAAKLIEESNRTMAPLANLAYVVRESCARGLPGAPARQARALLDYSRRALERLRSHATSLNPDPVATISYSSSVESVLTAVKPVRVVVFESRPGGEGAILAANLRVAGLEARLLPDTMMPHGLDIVDYILVGADAVTMDACLYNKVGTLQLAIIAREYDKKLVAVYDATKIHPSSNCENHPVEERTYMAAGYGPVRYPLFDRVPGDLIAASLTEEGFTPFAPENIEALWRNMIDQVLGDER